MDDLGKWNVILFADIPDVLLQDDGVFGQRSTFIDVDAAKLVFYEFSILYEDLKWEGLRIRKQLKLSVFVSSKSCFDWLGILNDHTADIDPTIC